MNKIFALFLALLMILSMLASCTPTDVTPDDSSAPEPSQSTPNESENPSEGGESSGQESEDDAPTVYENIGIPELNYDDVVINIACWYAENDEFGVTAEDANTGDPILDAIYKRNLYTEQTLGVKLNFVEIPGAGNQSEIISWCETAKNMQSDPATPVDILACYSRTAAYATITGLNQDLTVYDYLDLTKEWWPKNVQEEFAIGNKLFFITGDISTNVLHMMYCVFYNKTLTEAHGLGDPVQMVKDRTWTIDAWQNMTANLYQDIDGVPGKSSGDKYGAGFQYFHLDAVIQGSGFKLLENSSKEGEHIAITEDFYSQKFENYISDMIEWVQSDDVWSDIDYGAKGSTERAFLEGRIVFQLMRATFGFQLRETDVDYGILPPPMLDPSQQESYITTLGNPYSIYSMSRTTQDGDRTAAVLQTLGYYGYDLTTPAIFDVTFKGKFSKDPNAIDMFNLVRESIGFDLGILYSKELGGMCDLPTYNAISKGQQWSTVANNAFAKKTMATRMERLNKSLDNVVNA